MKGNDSDDQDDVIRGVGSRATPDVIETWEEVFQLYRTASGERRERLQQVAVRLGLTYKVVRRRLRNYEAMTGTRDPLTSKPPTRTSSGPRAPASASVQQGLDETRTCVDCGHEFPFSAKEQAFFAEKGFHPPKRCKACRQLQKERAAAR